MMKTGKPRGAVAAGHQVTASAGAEIMREGGNAVDAAIAAVTSSFIAEPVLTGAGGGGFMLIAGAGKRPILLDGFARMPSGNSAAATPLKPVAIDFGDTVQTFHIGPASVGTPSLMAMLFEAHRLYGRLPLREVLAPALDAARGGVQLNALQASFIGLLEPILTHSKSAGDLHAPSGKLLVEGDTFVNPDLANTLEMLAIEGIAEMYQGDLAREIVAACAPGGLLTMTDMQTGQVQQRQPLCSPLLGGELLTNPPPSSGGILISYALAILEQLQRDVAKPLPILIAEVLRSASMQRRNSFDQQIHTPGFARDFLHPEHLDQACTDIRQRLGKHSNTPAEASNRHGSTTQVSVIDNDGMAVSLTSSNGEGSGIVVPGTGIHLNNMLGEEDINPLGFHALPPGTTLSSMMAPSIFMQQGRPQLILGSGGSNRLRGAITQVLSHMIIGGANVEQAVHAPRLHNEGMQLDVEPGLLNDDLRDQLQDMGWKIREWSRQSVYFGGVHAIAVRGSQTTAAGDPRRGGAVAWA